MLPLRLNYWKENPDPVNTCARFVAHKYAAEHFAY